jgi:hypothetical protein
MLGAVGPGGTVKEKGGALIPFTCTVRSPVVAPLGTGATILVELQLVGVASTPLKLTVLDPCAAPNNPPVIVTGVPTGPEVGDRPVIFGERLATLLSRPFTVTTKSPGPEGAGTAILLLLQLVGVSAVPLTRMVLELCVAPNPPPVTVSVVEVSDQLSIRSACVTTKLMPLLATPFTATTTSPVVAPLGTGA